MTVLSERERRTLESQLMKQLRQGCEESESIGYSPKQYRLMLSESGAAGACQRVIMAAKIPDGFLTMLEKKRLDLTAEAIVLRGPWKALFEPETLDRARKRLRDYNRPDLALS